MTKILTNEIKEDEGIELGGIPQIQGSQSYLPSQRNLKSTIKVVDTTFDKPSFTGNSNDGLTENVGGGTGTVTRNLNFTILSSGNNGAEIYKNVWTSADSTELSWDNSYEVVIHAKISATGANNNVFLGVVNSNSASNVAASHSPTTGRHFGFIIDNDGIVASCGDVVTQNTSTVNGITVTDWNTYKIVKNTNVNILFYINDNLVATLSSNLPSGTTTPSALMMVIYDSTPVGRDLFLANQYSLNITKN